MGFWTFLHGVVLLVLGSDELWVGIDRCVRGVLLGWGGTLASDASFEGRRWRNEVCSTRRCSASQYHLHLQLLYLVHSKLTCIDLPQRLSVSVCELRRDERWADQFLVRTQHWFLHLISLILFHGILSVAIVCRAYSRYPMRGGRFWVRNHEVTDRNLLTFGQILLWRL